MHACVHVAALLVIATIPAHGASNQCAGSSSTRAAFAAQPVIGFAPKGFRSVSCSQMPPRVAKHGGRVGALPGLQMQQSGSVSYIPSVRWDGVAAAQTQP